MATSSGATERIKLPNIRTSIFKIRQLYNQVSNHLRILQRRAYIDGLTGIQNRRSFDETIETLLRCGEPFSLIIADIDFFKKVNDTYGHAVGDEVLRYLAQEMETSFCDSSICFRYGGEEFVILLQQTTEEEAYEKAEAFRRKIDTTNSPSGEPITISFGITSYHADDRVASEIVHRADEALYEAKQTGRNKTVMYNSELTSLQ